MLPQPDHLPTHTANPIVIFSVTLAVLGYFIFPEIRYLVLPGWEPVSMPKISVHEDDNPGPAEDYVRFAGQLLDMLTEP